MDRCALFVDAGYVLADGAMAVHGTRRRESVSWDYPGLLRLLASLATEHSGLPLLRCYWYESTPDGNRRTEHEMLADLPGIKLRLARVRPGGREGVDGEIRRDLTALARNKAVSDVMVVSGEEDLAQVIADVQDTGMRVSLLQVAADGNGANARALRQECDATVEVSAETLRPYVELISGAEPPRADEQGTPRLQPPASQEPAAPEPAVPEHAAAMPYPDAHPGFPQPSAPAAAAQAPAPHAPAAHSPAVQTPAPQTPAAAAQAPAAQAAAAYGPASIDFGYPAAADPRGDLGVLSEPPAMPGFTPQRGEVAGARQDAGPDLGQGAGPGPRQDLPARADRPARPELPARPEPVGGQELYGAPVLVPGLAERQLPEEPAARSRGMADLSGYNPGGVRDPFAQDAMPQAPVPVPVNSGQVRRLPARGQAAQAQAQSQAQPAGGQPAPLHPVTAQPGPAQPGPAQPAPAQQVTGQPPEQPGLMPAPAGQPSDGPGGGQQIAAVLPIGQGAAGYPANGNSYGGPRLVPPPGPMAPQVQPAGQPQPGNGAHPPQAAGMPAPPARAPQEAGPPSVGGEPPAMGQGMAGIGLSPETSGPIGLVPPGAPAGQLSAVGPGGPVGPAAYSGGQPGVSLAEAVQSAHEEGKEFGDSVARDAPALWLEAVLARKPRMPSDLEARLLQGSALPIDYLLHDEVRHALRRGFWDAMERARR